MQSAIRRSHNTFLCESKAVAKQLNECVKRRKLQTWHEGTKLNGQTVLKFGKFDNT